jgi:hypothetical protein
MARSRIVVIALMIVAGMLSAEEKSWAVGTAELVVVGKLELSSYFLSFDGVHVNGAIVPTEILYGNAQSGARLRYSYLIPCSVVDLIRDRSLKCDYRMVWSQWSFVKNMLTQNGVWLLWRAPGASWTGNRWDAGFRPLDYRDYAVSVLSKRREQETRH